MFPILAIVTGGNPRRGIVTFIGVHRHGLNGAFGLKRRRAAADAARRPIRKGLDPVAVEAVFRRHAALLQAARGSFGDFHGRAAAQAPGAFATEAPSAAAAQALPAARGVARGAIVTLDAMRCRNNPPTSPPRPASP